jgi:hypothetical protein
MAAMDSPERRLWLLLAVTAATAVGANALLLLFPWRSRPHGFAAGFFAAMIFLLNMPYCRAVFRSLSGSRRTLYIVAAFATLALAVSISNWGAPAPLTLDIRTIAVFFFLLVLFLALYPSFSKTMDALWLRFTRR